MRLKRANCGHYVLAGTPAAGTEDNDGIHSPQPVYLCAPCAEQVRRQALGVEAKALAPPTAPPTAPSEPIVSVPDRERLIAKHVDAGQIAAEAGLLRQLPASMKGTHPRSVEARSWFAGYDSAASGQGAEGEKADGKRTGGA